MLHTSCIDISKKAYLKNLKFIRDFIGEGVIFSSVVKGNAYGHGIEHFVPMAEECGVRHFSVFSADEAFRVKNVSKQPSTIMIMGMLDNYQLEWAIANDLEFFVFDMDRLENTLLIAKMLDKRAKVHIEIETGMNRTGFANGQLKKIGELLKDNPKHLLFKGVCTHYAGAESIANYYRIKKQRDRFSRHVRKLAKMGVEAELKHTACSAASLRYPKTQMDMVRIGILQYGFFPSQEVFINYITRKKMNDYPLERLISWKSKIMDINKIKTGEFVGYGTSFMANTNMTVAVVPVGYSHGYSRILSNQGQVLINGEQAYIVGMVNMNMVTVDVTYIKNVKKGDEVTIIGYQGDKEISVSSFSEKSEQVNYEMLTRLPSDLPRKIVE